MTDTAPSIVRTLAPLLAGWLAGLALRFGVHIDEATALGAVMPALSAAYYVLARLAEQHLAARWGWLLGWATAPTYGTTTSATGSASTTSTAG